LSDTFESCGGTIWNKNVSIKNNISENTNLISNRWKDI
jgi:hypothetical protein